MSPFFFGSAVSRTWFIDPINFVCTVGPVLSTFYFEPALVTLSSGKVLISSYYNQEEFDPLTGSSIIMNFPEPRSGSKTIKMSNGDIWLCGGATLGGMGTTNTLYYNPSSHTYSQGPLMSILRYGHRLFENGNGLVNIFGGNDNSSLVEQFNPLTGTISTAGHLPNPIAETSVIQGINGHILVWGSEYSNSGSVIYDYDPVTSISISKRSRGGMLHWISPSRVLVLKECYGGRVYYPARDEYRNSRYEKIWKVSQTEIDQFILDHANGALNFLNYPDIQTWPGNGYANLGEPSQLAPYVDVDGDLVYDPVNDGDYPLIRGTQALWYVSHDRGNAQPGNDYMGITMKTLAYSYDCGAFPCPDTSMDYSTFYNVKVTNETSHAYNNVYLGYFLDPDLGNYADDYLGSDPNLHLGFTYNGDANDDGGYGLNPPAFGCVFLCTPNSLGMTNVTYHNNDFTPQGNPDTKLDYYNYMRSRWIDNSPVRNNGGNGYDPSGTSPIANHVFPDDGGFCGGSPSGWSEVTAGMQAFDRRMVMSAGPFNFLPGEEKTIDFALVFSRAFYNDNLGSVCQLKQDVNAIWNWWSALPYGCARPIVALNTEMESLDFSVFPNPSSGLFTLSLKGDRATSVHVFDVQGKQIFEKVLIDPSEETQIDLLEAKSGVYLLEVEGKNGLKGRSKLVIY